MAKIKKSNQEETIPKVNDQSIESMLSVTEDMINNITNASIQGDINPLIPYIFFSTVATKLEEALKKIKNDALIESAKYEHDLFQGYFIKIMEAGVKYNYTDNPVYSELMEKIDTMMEEPLRLKKELETKLKTGYVDNVTGEVFPKVSKKSTEYIKFTKK